MNQSLRSFLAALLLTPALAVAQNSEVTPSLQVSQLAPQLIAFAGGQANFDNLVNGLALGSPVTLTTLSGGQVQTTSFTPQGSMTATQIAQVLETTRQSLISRGVAAPTGQQLAIVLTGGALPTPTGSVQVAATLPPANQPAVATAAAGATGATGVTSAVTTTTTPAPNPNGPPSPAAILQGQSGAGGTTPPSPAQVIQNNRGPNVSDTPTSGNISNTPSATTPSTTGSTTGSGTTAPAATPAPSGR